MTAKTTIRTTKATIKAISTAIKTIISWTQALIAAILAGGWIAIIIIIVICLIAMICSSVYGIFFSNESGVNVKSMSSVISETNKEFTNKITEIQNTNEHDDYEINSHRTEWKDVISVYTVLITGGKEQSDTITLDDKKIQKLKDIFWEMKELFGLKLVDFGKIMAIFLNLGEIIFFDWENDGISDHVRNCRKSRKRKSLYY